MKLLYAPSSWSFHASLLVLLDRDGVAYFASGADGAVAGIGGPLGGPVSRIYVHEDDFDEAAALVQELLGPAEAARAAARASAPVAPPRTLPLWAMLGAGLVIALVLGAVLGS